MRRKTLCFLLVFGFLAQAAFAAPSYMPRQGQNQVTLWNKVTDFFATVGKSKSDKIRIKRERQYNRVQERLQKQRDKFFKEGQQSLMENQ